MMVAKPLTAVQARNPNEPMVASSRTHQSVGARGTKPLSTQLRYYWHWVELRITGVFLATILVGHYMFKLPTCSKFIKLQHPQVKNSDSDSPLLYTRGIDDVYFLIFWFIAFTFLRAATMTYVLRPFARSQGLRQNSKLVRFAEQGWIMIYYSTYWSLGMYIMYHSTYWFNTDGLWRDHPNIFITGLTKIYYLTQLAFCLQQIFIVNVEEKRKDYAVMLTHHIITVTLVGTSYWIHQTPAGIAIMCTMDFADILLSAAKVFNYIKWQRTTDVCFVAFLIGWAITRHGFFNILFYSAYYDIPGYGVLNWDPDRGHYLGWPAYVIYMIMLAILQILCIYWFSLALKIAYKVVSGSKPEDIRSDDEDDGSESEDIKDEKEFGQYSESKVADQANTSGISKSESDVRRRMAEGIPRKNEDAD